MNEPVAWTCHLQWNSKYQGMERRWGNRDCKPIADIKLGQTGRRGHAFDHEKLNVAADMFLALDVAGCSAGDSIMLTSFVHVCSGSFSGFKENALRHVTLFCGRFRVLQPPRNLTPCCWQYFFLFGSDRFRDAIHTVVC